MRTIQTKVRDLKAGDVILYPHFDLDLTVIDRRLVLQDCESLGNGRYRLSWENDSVVLSGKVEVQKEASA